MKKQLLKLRIAPVRGKNRTMKMVLAAATAVFLLSGTEIRGGEDQQQVWLISTRSAPLSGDLLSGLKHIRYWRLSPDQQWQPADEESFHESDAADMPTTIAIHGNRVDPDEAIDFAWPIYCRMLKAAQDRPFRLVIWSWTSERMCRRHRPDVQLKFRYCDAQAFYLAECLQHRRRDAPLCLLGYSMGARIILGSLQLLAGGEVDCRTLANSLSSQEAQNRSAPIRVLMVAAAVDDDSLATDGLYNLALPQVQSMLVVRNSRDPVLKWYPRIYGRGGPEALGYVGPAGSGAYEKIELLDLSCDVGRIHKWDDYLTSCRLLKSIERYAIFPAIPDPEK